MVDLKYNLVVYLSDIERVVFDIDQFFIEQEDLERGFSI